MSSKFSLSTVAVCFLGAAFAAAHAKRSDDFTPLQLPLTSLPEWTHVVNVTIGTPGQSLPMIISTIHYHTWVPNADSKYCDAAGYHENKLDNGHHNIKPFPSVCRWGSFNSSLSKTYVDRTPNDQNTAWFQWFHEISEGVLEDNGGNINGMNFTDRLEAGDIVMDDYPMVLQHSGRRWIGVLGLKNRTGWLLEEGYPSFMERLVSSGRIPTNAFSVWLDNPEGTTGSVLFGAIDKSRYEGKLTRMVVGNSYNIYITSFSGIMESGEKLTPPPDPNLADPEGKRSYIAILTISNRFSYLPPFIADWMAEIVGARYNETLQRFTVPCDAGQSKKAKFSLQLEGEKGPVLTVEVSDLIIPVTDIIPLYSHHINDTGTYYSEDLRGNNTCFFGVQKDSEPWFYRIGSSLLRHTYMVFDNVNGEVGFAPVKFPSPDAEPPAPEIVYFKNYGATIPSSKIYCGASKNECIRAGYKLDQTRRNVGIAFGVIGGVLLVALLGWCFWKLYKRSKATAAAAAARDEETVAEDGSRSLITKVQSGQETEAPAATESSSSVAGQENRAARD